MDWDKFTEIAANGFIGLCAVPLFVLCFVILFPFWCIGKLLGLFGVSFTDTEENVGW